MNAAPRDPVVTLTANCQVADQWLRVQYKLSNAGEVVVLTYDGATGDPADEWPDLSRYVGVYVSYEAPALVKIKRVRAPVPEGRRIESVRIPTVYQLQPGQSRDVRFRLPLPLTEKSEYSPDFAGATYETKDVKKYELWLGYFVPTAENKLEWQGDDPKKAFKVSGPHGPQQYAIAQGLASFQVKVRTDDQFERV